MTCCALHNHLLDVDGLSHKWEDDAPSSYENDNGEFNQEDIPIAIRRLVDSTGNDGHRLRLFNSSRFGFRTSDDGPACNNDDDSNIDNDVHLV